MQQQLQEKSHFVRRARELGFDARSLVSQGVLTVHPALTLEPAPTLQDSIHALFRRNHWYGNARDVYQALKPALQLATLFPTEESISTFFHTLGFGKRIAFTYAGKWSDAKAKERDRSQFWIEKNVEPTLEGSASLRKMLADLAYRTQFRFLKMNSPLFCCLSDF